MSKLIAIQRNGLCTIQCDTCGAIRKDASRQNISKAYQSKTIGCKLCCRHGAVAKPKVDEIMYTEEHITGILDNEVIRYRPTNFILCSLCRKKNVEAMPESTIAFCDDCLPEVNEYKERHGLARY